MFCDVINRVLCFVENHPVLIGMLVFVSGAFWLRKYIRQRRVDACFGFYANVLLLVDRLHKTLDAMNLLDCTSFNIFSLHYAKDVIKAKYPGRIIDEQTVIPKKELDILSEPAAKLQNVLINAENNITPQKVKVAQWYGYQHIIIDLCALILGKYNLEIVDGENQKPSDLCKEAKTAMDGIAKSIIKEQGLHN
jgi:hypothetical protein